VPRQKQIGRPSMTFSEFTTSLRNPNSHRRIPPNSILAMSLPPNDPTSLTPGFQFVNISDPADMKAPEHRKFVRKSVASNHRKRQVLGLSPAFGQSSPPHSCSAKGGDSHQSYCQACGTSIQTRRDSLSLGYDRKDESLYLFGKGVDPFNNFPIPSRPYMEVLVDHCKCFRPFKIRNVAPHWLLLSLPGI
jgi:hypothetical protein